MTGPFDPLTFSRGPRMKNRFVLAPMTNCQSHADGRLSADEEHWLALRARGGFGLTMTCAAMVQPAGRGFPGQLGASSDDDLDGLTRLAGTVRAGGSLSSVQLHHAGDRADRSFVSQPLAPSPSGTARALTLDEVATVREDFIAAAVRVERAGFDGVELHGAHGYLLAQFLSPEGNRRQDCYGGSLENRARLLQEIIAGIRTRCGPDFQLGLRLSPEQHGVRIGETLELVQQLFDEHRLDYLDLSLRDVEKAPEEPGYQHRGLLSWFTGLRRGETRLGCAGKINSAGMVRFAMAEGADFVLIGRAAILHCDFPHRVESDPAFVARYPPVTDAYLEAQGVTRPFRNYLRANKFLK